MRKSFNEWGNIFNAIAFLVLFVGMGVYTFIDSRRVHAWNNDSDRFVEVTIGFSAEILVDKEEKLIATKVTQDRYDWLKIAWAGDWILATEFFGGKCQEMRSNSVPVALEDIGTGKGTDDESQTMNSAKRFCQKLRKQYSL